MDLLVRPGCGSSEEVYSPREEKKGEALYKEGKGDLTGEKKSAS